nr:aldehyde ferredoxin oxidoreductase N-terminal domain-containing protein [Synergistales bacterium]
MTFSGGFTGKLLRIDLSGKEYVVEEINESILRKFVGGASLAARILYDELSPGTDPLGPGNILVFTAGPLTGTRTPCASRLNVGTKSPLTGCLANALTGGYFPAEMKWAGYDGI